MATHIENFNNWKCRCSSLGNIVTKSGKLTDGAMTHLTDVFIGEMYGIRKEAYGKALEKGVACEQDGFRLLNDTLYPGRFVAKVEETRENDYIKGTPDTIMDGIVYDIKNAWDLFTFGKADLSWLYQWQLKGYMMLHDLQHGRLFYCINNMPEHMLSEEERKLFYTERKWMTMDDPGFHTACDELRKRHIYDHMPLASRFKLWGLERSQEDDQRIIEAVAMARKFLNELLEEHNSRIVSNYDLMKAASEKEAA